MKLFLNSVLVASLSFQSFSALASDVVTSDDIAQLQSQLDSLSNQITTLNNENDALESQLSQQLATLSNQQLLISNLQTQNSSLSSTLETLTSEVETIQTDSSSSSNVPIGTIVAWHRDQPGVPELGSDWVICNGDTILDPTSPLYGQETPDLTSDKYQAGRGTYLRGGTESGLFNESTQLTDNGYKYAFKIIPAYYGASYFSIFNAEDYNDGAFYSESNHVKARFQVAAMTVVWVMKVK